MPVAHPSPIVIGLHRAVLVDLRERRVRGAGNAVLTFRRGTVTCKSGKISLRRRPNCDAACVRTGSRQIHPHLVASPLPTEGTSYEQVGGLFGRWLLVPVGDRSMGRSVLSLRDRARGSCLLEYGTSGAPGDANREECEGGALPR